MANKKTIAIFGAGTGLGASLATRFGREGYRVALVARRAAPLEERVAELTRAGIEVAAFPADLTNLDSIPALVRSIEARFGAIDVAVYQPVGHVGFVPAVELDAAKRRLRWRMRRCLACWRAVMARSSSLVGSRPWFRCRV
jgi:NAD(P)-dependent dehydrogenase (short-subunit alcohol dehydrogenase family)